MSKSIMTDLLLSFPAKWFCGFRNGAMPGDTVAAQPAATQLLHRLPVMTDSRVRQSTALRQLESLKRASKWRTSTLLARLAAAKWANER
jgi:hypothetical protein